MASVQELRRPAPPSPPRRSATREKLAAAIDRVHSARAALDRVRQARAKVGFTWEASAAVEAAERAVAEAREREPRRMVDALLGIVAASPAQTVEDAEAELRAASAEVDRRRRVHALLDEEERSAEAELRRAEDRCHSARSAALAADPATHRLIAEFETTKRRLEELKAAMRALSSADGVPLTPGRDWRGDAPFNIDGDPVYRAAIGKLMEEADAPLPDLGGGGVGLAAIEPTLRTLYGLDAAAIDALRGADAA